MKVQLTILTTCLALVANGAFAQDFVFKVLTNKGENSTKTQAQDKEWTALKTGASLQKGEVINVSEGAFIGLVHANGKTIELTTAGQYHVSTLSEKIGSESTGVAGKYADFLLGKITEEEEGEINDNHRQHLNVTGAVERSLENFAITAMIPANGEVLNAEAFVRWSALGEGKTYVVSLKNMFNEVLATKETTENYLAINLNDAVLEDEKVVIFSVSVKDDSSLKSDNYGLKRMSGEDALKIRNELNLLQADLNASPALNDIMLASFFEQNNLMLDAIVKYESAIASNPEMEDFKIAYNDLIEKNGLN